MKKLYLLLVCLMTISLIFACGKENTTESNASQAESSPQKSAPEYVFTYAENHPGDYPTVLGALKFAEIVKERTNGRIEINVQYGGVLGDEKSVIEQLQFGGIDFTRVSISPLSEFVPKLNVLQMPYLYNSAEHMWEVLDGPIGEDFLNAFSSSNLVALSWYASGARSFYNTKKEIKTLEDMKGLKIRVQESTLMMGMVEALGANPTPMAYGEVYSALQTGVIDGAENNWPSYESSTHYEVSKFYTLDEHTRVPELQLISQVTWNKLSDEDKKIIQEAGKESALYQRQLWAEREEASEAIVKESGVTITYLSDAEKARFQNAVLPMYQKFVAEYMDIVDQIIEVGK